MASCLNYHSVVDKCCPKITYTSVKRLRNPKGGEGVLCQKIMLDYKIDYVIVECSLITAQVRIFLSAPHFNGQEISLN